MVAFFGGAVREEFSFGIIRLRSWSTRTDVWWIRRHYVWGVGRGIANSLTSVKLSGPAAWDPQLANGLSLYARDPDHYSLNQPGAIAFLTASGICGCLDQ
jgi:hypothetical protein